MDLEKKTHWYDLGTGSKVSEYEYVQKAQGKLEGYYKSGSANDPLYLLNIIALLSLALGTRNPKELLAGAVGFIPQWYFGGDGFDGVVAALTGIQTYKGRWMYVAFPLLLESLRTLKDFTKGKQITKPALSRMATFLGGYVIAMTKIV